MTLILSVQNGLKSEVLLLWMSQTIIGWLWSEGTWKIIWSNAHARFFLCLCSCVHSNSWRAGLLVGSEECVLSQFKQIEIKVLLLFYLKNETIFFSCMKYSTNKWGICQNSNTHVLPNWPLAPPVLFHTSEPTAVWDVLTSFLNGKIDVTWPHRLPAVYLAFYQNTVGFKTEIN